MRNIKEQFEQDGFVVLEDFLSEADIKELEDEAANLIKNMPPPSQRSPFSTKDSKDLQNKNKYFLDSADKISYFYEVGALGPNGELKVDPHLSLFRVGHALHALNPVFRKLALDERVKECCYQLGFEDPGIVQSMFLFKNPELGSEVTVHQDASYLHTEPVKVLGFWFALEDATIENGCLWFAKGSHKSGIHRRYYRNPDKNSDELLVYDKPAPTYQSSSFTPVPAKRGTAVLIHGQVVHYSEPNKSQKSRHAYTFHVIEQKNCKWSENNWLQYPPGKPFFNIYKTKN